MHQLCFLINFDTLQQSRPDQFPLQNIIDFLVFSKNICVFFSYMNSQSVNKDSTDTRQSDLQYIAKEQNKFNSIFLQNFHLVLFFLACIVLILFFVSLCFLGLLSFYFSFCCFSFKKRESERKVRLAGRQGWSLGI